MDGENKREENVKLKPLTKKQANVLEFVIKQIESGYGTPTIREIGTKFSMKSTGSVRDITRALIKKGYMLLLEAKSRGRILNPEVFKIEVKGKEKIHLKPKKK